MGSGKVIVAKRKLIFECKRGRGKRIDEERHKANHIIAQGEAHATEKRKRKRGTRTTERKTAGHNGKLKENKYTSKQAGRLGSLPGLAGFADVDGCAWLAWLCRSRPGAGFSSACLKPERKEQYDITKQKRSHLKKGKGMGKGAYKERRPE